MTRIEEDGNAGHSLENIDTLGALDSWIVESAGLESCHDLVDPLEYPIQLSACRSVQSR